MEMYEPRQVVKDFSELKVMQLFDLIKADTEDSGIVPDMISRNNSFFVEVKASAYSNGGVIKKKQLYRFDEQIHIRRFYAFFYHSIARDMTKDYPAIRKLKSALDLRALYLFPFSIVKAYFEKSKKRKPPRFDTFVQLREWQAINIFEGEEEIWARLGLDFRDYKRVQPHEKVHIMTRGGYLESEILASFHSKFI